MKKIILLALGILLTLTGCGVKGFDKVNGKISNSENTIKSLNGFLEYELPIGWQQMRNFSKPMEISIETVNASVLVEYIQDIPENFMKFKEETIKLESIKYNFLEDYNFERNDKNIISKVYVREDKSDSKSKKICRLIGTIEFDKNEDAFLGIDIIFSVSGSKVSPEVYKFRIDEIFDVLDTIKFTGVKLDEKRNVVLESECIELTLQPLWQRLNKVEENAFYKSLEKMYLINYFNTFSKKETSPQEELEKLCLKFEEIFAENNVKIYSTNTEDLKDKTITGKAYETDIGYGYFNIIDFKNSDLFVIANYSIISSEGKFEDIKKELDEMTKSINLIKDAEKKFAEYKSIQDAHNKINDFIENMETDNTNN